MCGRAYAVYRDDELEGEFFLDLPKYFSARQPAYNLAPTQETLLVSLNDSGEKIFAQMRWGLIPAWSQNLEKGQKMSYKMINARSETIDEKPSYRQAFLKRRCILPVSGFYEWKKDGKKKRPFKIFLKDKPILSMAAIWESWNPKSEGDLKPIHSFSVVTTECNSLLKDIHNRMPVILEKSNYDTWLNGDPGELKKLMKPFEPSKMNAREVSTLVNSPRNNGPENLIELKSEPGNSVDPMNPDSQKNH